MIQLLSAKYNKHIAFVLLFLFSLSLVPARGGTYRPATDNHIPYYAGPFWPAKKITPPVVTSTQETTAARSPLTVKAPAKKYIGGPTQPEMSSFKPVGADDMVNLFTGDFNYNIPLLDVGGYPVNIFYDGSVSVDQEASWVGLGWNINPGNINRNMRGVPDDFNGTDTLKQTQNMKPNRTWGISVNGDLELAGYKKMPEWLSVSIGANLGLSFNNYLGPAMDFGLKGGVGFKLQNVVKSEKNTDTLALKVKVGLGANLNSRYGMTLSPNMSITSTLFNKDQSLSAGFSLGTSYNSRSGIKALQISEQVSFYTKNAKTPYLNEYLKQETERAGILSASISFAKPSYIPAIRMPVTNQAISGHFQLGGGTATVYASGEIEVYKQVSQIDGSDVEQHKPMVGYMYYQNAQSNPDAVMDFTRFNDKEVTSNTPLISAPQYSYDVFSIQGEGTGGSIRAYRSDNGYVRDNYTYSKDKNLSGGADIGVNLQHFGANFNTISTPSTIGEWNDGNKIRSTIGFKNGGGLWENVYFRNPGEVSVLNDQQFDSIGGTDLVRFKLGGTRSSPAIEPKLERMASNGQVLSTINIGKLSNGVGRQKRTQVINMLTAGEAALAGLDKKIKNYDRWSLLDESTDTLKYAIINRVGSYRKAHHISQINVTEANGSRYIYGIPVYNTVQKDFAFSVDGDTPPDQETVDFTSHPDYASGASSLLETDSKVDGYLQITETPAYAHSFLLSGLLSPDYVDVTDNGITEDDLGDAVKFNYSRLTNHAWRTPLPGGKTANFNPGNRTSNKDDKGIISYGERESWYLHSIESKNMIAFFTLENRADAKGVSGHLDGINTTDTSVKRLKQIDLYNKADLKKNGLAHARPVKTVHFEYSYALCQQNPAGTDSGKGKLTLEKIYFTFNGQNRNSKNQYLFSYADTTADNPNYQFNASDRWGSFKPKEANPQTVTNAVFPYSTQPQSPTELKAVKHRAGAWALKKILLPSGGQLEVEYESDDYAFVQNKRAAVMMTIAGLGHDNGAISNKLYDVSRSGITDNERIYIDVPDACTSKQEVYDKYLQGVEQLAFKLAVYMPKGVEYVNSYAFVEDYNVVSGNPTRIWIKVAPIDGVSPLALTAVEYLRNQLPGQAFPGYDVSDGSSMQQIGGVLAGMLEAIKGAFADPFNHLRRQGMAQSVDVLRSFVRLNDPDGRKYGGGNRVRKVVLKDNWKAMTNQYTSVYGKEYDYTTTEILNGKPRVISSGVASYEPGIGGEENPFQIIMQVANKLPMGPTSYDAVEMPVLDAFFPAPVVGYSKVTVRSLKKGIDTTLRSRSGVGKQVTEFYTAKDYPVYYTHTAIDPSSNKEIHQASMTAFLYKYSFDSRAISQGFLVATNDMHGKLKSQSSYAENDTLTRINYSENFYRNTGSKGLNEKFDFVYNKDGGVVKQGNMGIDIELMTDTREFTVKSNSVEVQGNLDHIPIISPAIIWLPFIWGVVGDGESTYRAVTTTKVITYHSILDSTVVIDKGSQVSTRNLVFDAETGTIVVNRTNNEFDQPVYNTTYPAYWAYSGMGLAYKNIDAIYSNINFYDGKIVSNNIDQGVFESGDELFITNQGAGTAGCIAPADTITRLWAFDKNKDTTALAVTNKDLIFLDEGGKPYTKNGVGFRIIRSGKRNMLNASLAAISSMVSPINSVTHKLAIDSSSKVINATAIEYREKWQLDNELIRKLRLEYVQLECTYKEVIDCAGYLEKSINPYRKGMVGNFRPHRSMVYYANRTEINAQAPTNLPNNGFLAAFKPYWNFDVNNQLVPDVSNSKWVWNEKSTRINAKGMEVESMNALNIYTAAQYGYNKTLPVSIVNNSRSYEMAYEGFEDLAYDNTINGNNYLNPCAERHFSLANLSNASIVNTDTSQFAAHTGKFVMAVKPHTEAAKQFAVTGTAIDDMYELKYKKDTTRSLSVTGSNYQTTPSPSYTFGPAAFINIGTSPIVSIDFYDGTINPSSPTENTYLANFDFYMYMPESRVYHFDLQMGAEPYDYSTAEYYYNYLSVSLQNVDIPTMGTGMSIYLDETTFYKTGTAQAYLCAGMYHVTGNAYLEQRQPFLSSAHHWFGWSCNDNSTEIYKTLTKEDGCISTLPLKTEAPMINPLYKVPAGKKMLFSAWVKEPCGDVANGIPCAINSYTGNSVKLEFDDAGTATDVTLAPSGPIIDGWQRIEDSVNVPANANNMTLKFINTTGNPIYYDDIRILPFNANMKSFVYDPVNLRLVAQLDENNYATFYEYDAEGTLIRTKVETREGIKTIQETRSFKQKSINTFQP